MSGGPQGNEASRREIGGAGLPYHASLDGLRGVALIAILFYHSGVNWIPGGFLSVSTFFTLSGFLITALLLSEWDRTGRVDLRAFWTRRLRRLMPGALVALLFLALLGGTIGDASQVERLTADGLAALFYVSNWRFISLGTEYADLFASPSLVQHFWSLSIEEQFYLSYPLVFVGVLRHGGRRGLATLLLLTAGASTLWTASLYRMDAPISRLYFGTDTRITEILLGALFAIWYSGRPPLGGRVRHLAGGLGLVGVVGSLAYWFSVSESTPFLWQGGMALYSALTVAAIAGCLQPIGPARAVLAAGPLPWLGRVSYGAYLYHFPVYVTVTGPLTGLAPWPLFGLRIGLTFALVIVSYYWLERPVRIGQRLKGSAFWVATPAGAAATVVALLVAGTTVDAPKAREEPPATARPDGGAPSVLIVGDSVAELLDRSLTRVQADFGLRTITRGAIACSFIRSYRIRGVPEHAIVDRTGHCSKLRGSWGAWLERFDPSVVLLLTGWPGFGEKWIDGDWHRACDPEFRRAFAADLAEAVGVLGATGARVAIVTAPPAIIEDVRFGRSAPDLAEMERRNRASSACQDAIRSTVAEGTGAALIDLTARVCPGGVCTRKEEGVVLRPDGVHFSGPGGDVVAAWLLSEVVPLLEQRRRPSLDINHAERGPHPAG